MKWIAAFGGCVVLINTVLGQPYGLNSRPTVGHFLNSNLPPAAPVLSSNWSTVVAFPNLLFTNAVGLAAMPGTTKLVVWEREGRIYHFENQANTANKTLVLNIANRCQGWDDSGLLGVAFHPGFATNRYMFVWYTWVSPGTVLGNANTRPPTATPNRDRLSRFILDANGVALATETIFIDQSSQTVWHNGGGMFFGDDGFLYITNGDDAQGANNQRINVSLHSGVLRIDVDRRGGSISHAPPRQPTSGVTANYFIPNDNPFVGQANVLEEFFAIGLRSPHRMTFDRVSRRIFIGDVGEGTREEVSVIEPGERGLNFQWNRIEGLNGDLTAPFIGVNKRPIIDYTHSEGFAVIGGYVYRGTELAPELSGRYIFGDNGSKRIWVLNEGTVPATKTLLATLPAGSGPNSGNDYVGLSSFGPDANNELYMCQMSSVGGRIYKLQRGGAASRPLPRRLSQTGAFANTATLTPSSGLIPYDVASPLWSDGAIKARWMAVPSSGQIGFNATGEWTFPNGSVFVKHFELPVDDRNSARKRLETRLLVRETNGYVYGATYKWRSDNTDADLLDSQLMENISVATATGTRTQTWYYPSQQDCLACHTVAAGGVLGVKTRQSNREFYYASTGVTDNQLRAWNHAGLFTPTISEASIPGLSRLVAVTNAETTLEYRVRSYIDANCSHCHRPGGVQALWDGRIETQLGSANIINGTLLNTLGTPGARNVVPGDLLKSIMHRRVNTADPAIRMPPLAKNVIDVDAVAALSEWILSLPPDFSTHTLVDQGSWWKYLDNNSDQGTAWRNLTFNDSAWASGPAQLGFGESDEATVVNGGPSTARYITTYFRQKFMVTNALAYTNLAIRLLRDDGAVGYLNGAEIFRQNMPTGTITRATYASGAVANADERTFFGAAVVASALIEGTNILAVEIHQANATSSDTSFDLELTGRRYAAPVRVVGEGVGASHLRLSFNAPTGIRFVVDASADLRTWISVHTNATANGRFEWVENRSPTRRFYRARQQ